jgi:predicted alpha/beta-fold hydrolase
MLAMRIEQSSHKPFLPHPLVRSATAQTVLAMLAPEGIDIARDEQPLLLDAGYDHTGIAPEEAVRLLAYFNASRRPGRPRGLVLVLHGWEGCSHSNYNVILAQALVEAGYDTVRLNLRDHGPHIHADAHALNRGIVLGTLIEEAAEATRQIALLAGDQPFFITGGSMGGNFALRLALWHGRHPFHNLRRVVAICPAVNPATATDALDRHPATRRYFRTRWLRSLRAKQRLFPELYDFRPLEQIASVRDMTDWLIRHYRHLTQARFAGADDYFRTYSVLPGALAHVTVPTTIITAANDPVIPVVDIASIQAHSLLDVQIHPSGGHCGFVDVWPVKYAMPGMVVGEIGRGEDKVIG